MGERRFLFCVLTSKRKKHTIGIREYSLMVKPQLPKLMPRVRFPLLAPKQKRAHTRSFFVLAKSGTRTRPPRTRDPHWKTNACGGAMFSVLRSKWRSATAKENLPRMRSIRVRVSRYSLQKKKTAKRSSFLYSQRSKNFALSSANRCPSLNSLSES